MGLGDEMVSTLPRNARDVGFIPFLDTIFPIFITPMRLIAVIRILYKLCAELLLNLPCVDVHEATACM